MTTSKIPKLIFIVPYRDREEQRFFFEKQMKYILEDMSTTDYKILYSHQCDDRKFNRGAMKNIGFLVIKQMYPQDYKDITIVFNDVDTTPKTKGLLKYNTTPGIVKHFYGYNYTLGGIVSITGGDFEKIGGFPNLWAWGFEDNILQNRVIKHNLIIDRNNFFHINDTNIIQMTNGFIRELNKDEYILYAKNQADNINDITDLQYNIDEETGFINISGFDTKYKPTNHILKHDTRNGNRVNFGKNAPSMKMFF